MPNHRHTLPTRLLAALFAIGLLMADALAASNNPASGLTVFGNFKRINHSGDASGQVKLSDLPATPGHWGLGALAGMKGEALLFDGRLLVTTAADLEGRASRPGPDDEAALFVWAQVRDWDEVALPAEMTQVQFESFLAVQARSRGMAADRPFLFLVRGRYPQLAWHVVNGMQPHGMAPEAPHGAQSNGHANGHANRHAAMQVFNQPAASGWLVGVYSGAQFEGVVSHPGERFHLHYADEALSASGHVDAFSVASGAVLKLPRATPPAGR